MSYLDIETEEYWGRVEKYTGRWARDSSVEVVRPLLLFLPDAECACRYGGYQCQGPKRTGLDVDWETMTLKGSGE